MIPEILISENHRFIANPLALCMEGNHYRIFTLTVDEKTFPNREKPLTIFKAVCPVVFACHKEAVYVYNYVKKHRGYVTSEFKWMSLHREGSKKWHEMRAERKKRQKKKSKLIEQYKEVDYEK